MAVDVSLSQLKGYCDAIGVPHLVREDEGVIAVAVPTPRGTYMVIIGFHPEREVVKLYVRKLLTVPEERRNVVALAACHVNTRIFYGAFGLDAETGELTFDMVIPYHEVGVSERQLGMCLAATAWTIDAHLPVFQRLCSADAPVEDVLGLPLASPVPELLAALGAEDGKQAGRG